MLGLGSSYVFDFPYGPSIVLSLGVFFICAIAIRFALVAGSVPDEKG